MHGAARPRVVHKAHRVPETRVAGSVAWVRIRHGEAAAAGAPAGWLPKNKTRHGHRLVPPRTLTSRGSKGRTMSRVGRRGRDHLDSHLRLPFLRSILPAARRGVSTPLSTHPFLRRRTHKYHIPSELAAPLRRRRLTPCRTASSTEHAPPGGASKTRPETLPSPSSIWTCPCPTQPSPKGASFVATATRMA